jgi:hypothetical protein
VTVAGAFAPSRAVLVNATGSQKPQQVAHFVSITVAVFYLLAAVTVVSALGVAFSTSIIYSAFALMGALLGVGGLFVLLGATSWVRCSSSSTSAASSC